MLTQLVVVPKGVTDMDEMRQDEVKLSYWLFSTAWVAPIGI